MFIYKIHALVKAIEPIENPGNGFLAGVVFAVIAAIAWQFGLGAFPIFLLFGTTAGYFLLCSFVGGTNIIGAWLETWVRSRTDSIDEAIS